MICEKAVTIKKCLHTSVATEINNANIKREQEIMKSAKEKLENTLLFVRVKVLSNGRVTVNIISGEVNSARANWLRFEITT